MLLRIGALLVLLRIDAGLFVIVKARRVPQCKRVRVELASPDEVNRTKTRAEG